jgi:hypothetical protein
MRGMIVALCQREIEVGTCGTGSLARGLCAASSILSGRATKHAKRRSEIGREGVTHSGPARSAENPRLSATTGTAIPATTSRRTSPFSAADATWRKMAGLSSSTGPRRDSTRRRNRRSPAPTASAPRNRYGAGGAKRAMPTSIATGPNAPTRTTGGGRRTRAPGISRALDAGGLPGFSDVRFAASVRAAIPCCTGRGNCRRSSQRCHNRHDLPNRRRNAAATLRKRRAWHQLELPEVLR